MSLLPTSRRGWIRSFVRPFLVISAILLDYEARSTDLLAEPAYGKQREPLLRVTAAARALPPNAPVTGTYTENGTSTIYITNTAPHRLGTNDVIWLNFTDTSSPSQPPPNWRDRRSQYLQHSFPIG